MQSSTSADFMIDDEMKRMIKSESREWNFTKNQDTAFVEARAKYKNLM
jgi:hypothetical protein